jgi:hypothetical protein
MVHPQRLNLAACVKDHPPVRQQLAFLTYVRIWLPPGIAIWGVRSLSSISQA